MRIGGRMVDGIVFCQITKLDFKIGSMLRIRAQTASGVGLHGHGLGQLLWEGVK